MLGDQTKSGCPQGPVHLVILLIPKPDIVTPKFGKTI